MLNILIINNINRIISILLTGYLCLIVAGCSAQTNLVEDEQQTVVTENLKYYLYYPQDYEINPDKRSALLLFLHGGGEAGANLEDLQINGPPKMIAEGKQFPFLILAPQHPHKRKFWNTEAVMQLLDSVIHNNNVDTNRIYLTGLSRGATAAWELAVQYPDKFAAMAVVCGMTPVPYASWIDKNMPIRIFHGEDDAVISVEESEIMAQKLLQMGYDVTFTKYTGVGHDAWTKAYQNEELYTWFMNQKRKD